MFTPLDSRIFKEWVYPGGEIGVRYTADPPSALLARVHNNNELMRLVMYLSVVPDNSVQKVFIPYLPYARQDRVATVGDPIAIRVLARILATTLVRQFLTLDVHSNAARFHFLEAGLLLDSIDPTIYIKKYIETAICGIDYSPFCFISPDKGAEEKTVRYAKALGDHIKVIQCTKERDPRTGTLSRFVVPKLEEEYNWHGYEFVIVDDICDGGGTFIGLAKEFRKVYGDRIHLHLWTTHGIYSSRKGIYDVAEEFDTVGCTNSFLNNQEHSRLTTISIERD